MWRRKRSSSQSDFSNFYAVRFWFKSLSLSHTCTAIYIYMCVCVCLHIYIYIYISCKMMEFKICIFWQHFFIDTYLIEHNIHFFVYIFFFVKPFELPYWSYDIWRELDDKPSIISYFPSAFCPTWGHHQGRMYYKSDVTFVCTLLFCKNERLYSFIV